MATIAGVRDRLCQPGASSAERIPGRGESHLESEATARLRLGDPERATLAEIGKRLGRKELREVTCVAKPDTILA